MDAFSTQELQAKASATNAGAQGVPEIDYVWKGQRYADLISERFTSVFSAHNIEHQPDLITHFRELAEILEPDGRLYFAIPDRRYCFDHFLPDTNFADLFGALYDRRRRHTAASVFEHRMLTAHNDAARHWLGDHGEPPLNRPVSREQIDVVHETISRIESTDGYIDTHAWQFTPHSFTALINLLAAAEVIPFTLERVYPTVRNSNEFYVVLSRA